MMAGCPWKGLCRCPHCMFLVPNDVMAECAGCCKEALRAKFTAYNHLMTAPNGKPYCITVVYCDDCRRERK